MRKSITKVLAIVAFLSVAVAGIGKANAYFTTYAEATGGYTIELGDETTIEEKFDQFKKTVSILNSSESAQAVYVRAMAFAGSGYELRPVADKTDAHWGDAPAQDGYWYYSIPVLPGEHTEDLTLEIFDAVTGEHPVADAGKTFDIVIVYETTPAVQNGEDADGNTQYEDADWTQSKDNGWTRNTSTTQS